MKWLLTLSFCCLVACVSAQTRFNYSLDWTRGTVVLQTGDTLYCNIRFNQSLPEGILQVLDGAHIVCLSVKDVKSFDFFDDQKGKLRTFYAIDIPAGPKAEVNRHFCERLYTDSRFSIIRHRSMGVPYEYMNYVRFISKTVVINQKFIVDEVSGKLVPMSRENTLLLLEEKKPQINAFINDQRIKFKTVGDYIKVFKYHNSLL